MIQFRPIYNLNISLIEVITAKDLAIVKKDNL